MNYKDVVMTNFSQLLMLFAMGIFNSPNYINIPLVITDVSLLAISGVLLFLELDVRLMRFIVLTEFIVSMIEYCIIYKFISIELMIIFLILIFLGFFTSFLPQISLGLYIALVIVILDKIHVQFFGTDEIMIDYYSASLFLHTVNPYIPANTANVYQVYHQMAPSFGTPLTTGGLVTNLNYPSLSFLIQIPAVLLHVSPNYTLIFFFIATMVLYYIILLKQNSLDLYPLFISAIYLNLNYFFYVRGGVPDIVWVFFLSLCLFTKDIRLKGIFYGIATSFKQMPLFLLPFLLIYLRKEKLSIWKFLVYMTTTFFVFNVYFIVINPGYYFYDLLYPMTANLIGISIGPSIFAFNGIFYVYKTFFIITMIIIGLIEIILFITYYEKFRNTWTAFPYFIMYVGYRVLWNYLMYWPFFNYIDKQDPKDDPDDAKDKIKFDSKKISGIVAITFVLLIVVGFYCHFVYSPLSNSIHISIIKILEKDGYIYSIILNISYTPTSSNLPKVIQPYFRIFPDQPMITANGLLWKSNASLISTNSWEIVELTPLDKSLEFKPVEFEVEAYYGNLIATTIVNPLQSS